MNRLLAIVLSALVATSAAAVVTAAGEWQTKVDTSVLREAEIGNADFIVYMREKADLTMAGRLSTKDAKGAFVYSALTKTAETSQAGVLDLLSARGVDTRSFWISNAIHVSGANLTVLEEVAQRADVEAVFAVGEGRLHEPVERVYSDSLAPDALHATAAAEPSLIHVNADDAWALGHRGQGVVVAGADTGVRWTHSAIKRQYRGYNAANGTADHNYSWRDAWAGANAVCPANSNEPCDDHDHGTHTVGTIVGDDGGSNQIGVAPDAQWIACRNMNQGLGVVPTYMDCMEWFIAPTDSAGQNADPTKAPDVVNNSWGCVEACAPPLLKDMTDASRAAGIVYVVSAGNDNQFTLGNPQCNTVLSPLAVYKSAFSVGATNATNDTIASFSSRGPVVTNPIEGVAYRKPDISAPGVGIRSATSGSDSSYASFSGTSMAGPHVAGVVALIISANPDLRGHVGTIEDIIEQTAVPRTSTAGCGGDSSSAVPNNVYGWGRIDALAAVQLAETTDPEATPTPTATATETPTSTPTPSPTATATPTSTPTSTPYQCVTTTWSDDLEPSADPDWRTGKDANQLSVLSPTWSVTVDTGAHSPTHSWSNDARTLGLKDTMLIAPTQKIGSTTTLSFWHRYFTEEGYDGGVLEVSVDGGLTWRDVTTAGAFISGGYNGTISTDYGSAIAGRNAWTGGLPTARVDDMTRVEVALGGFVPTGQPSVNAQIRWRYASDELAVGALPGDEWWIDDVQFADVVVSCATATPTASPTGTASPTPTPTPSATPTPTPSPSGAVGCTADNVYFLGIGYDPAGREDFKADVRNFEYYLSRLRETYCIPESQATILAMDNNWRDPVSGKTYAEGSEANLKSELRRMGALASQHPDSQFFFFLSSHGIMWSSVLPGSQCPLERTVGSLSGLKSGDGENGDLYDCELGVELNANFAPTTRMFVAVDCSFCGGFSDSITAVSGTISDGSVPASSGIPAENRIVITGCAITTECFGSSPAENGGVTYHHMRQVLEGNVECDGWTAPGFPTVQGFDAPVQDPLLNAPDGRCTASEWFFGAVWSAYSSGDVIGIQQQFRIKYGFDSLADDLLIVVN